MHLLKEIDEILNIKGQGARQMNFGENYSDGEFDPVSITQESNRASSVGRSKKSIKQI